MYHLMDIRPLVWIRLMYKYNFNPIYDPETSIEPYRSASHPRLRWDDHIHGFCLKTWPQYSGHHWFDILNRVRGENYEDEYVLYLSSERLR